MRSAKALALALMLAVAAGTARAEETDAVKYVSPKGTASWENANFSSNPAPLSAANANATFGTVVQMLDGTYTSGIAPNAAGVRFLGNVATPESVSVASVQATDDTWVRGVTSRGSVTFAYLATRVVVEDFTAASLDMQDARDCRVSRGTITGQIRLCRDVYPTPEYPDGKKAWAWRDTIEDVTCTAPLTTGWAMIFGKATATYQAQELVDSAVVRRITFRPPAVSGTNFNSVVKLFVVNHSTFEDIDIAYTSSATDPGPDEGDLGVVIVRDSSSHNVFRRVIMDINNPTGKEITGFATYVGVTDGGFQGDSYANAWEDCDIRILRARHTGVWYCNSSFDSLRLVGNVFATRGGGPALYFSLGIADASVATMAPTIVHNTLYNAAGPTYENRDATVHVTGAQVSGNIFYRGDASGCVRIEKNARYGDHTYFNDDSSLVYAVGGDRERYVGESGCAWKSQPTMHWSNPQFTDTTWAALDLTPLAGSPALSDSFPGGYAGALSEATEPPADSCADASRPGRVTTLTMEGVANSDSAIVMGWLKLPGPDQFSGDAAGVRIYFRRSPSPILTESDWAAAEPSDVINGATVDELGYTVGDSAQIWVAGMTPGVTWYALKSENIASGLWSCLSNTDSVYVAASGDAVRPAAVSDLAVRSPWNGFVRLAWTAAGDDSLTGTAAAYDVRYRLGETITSATWDDTVHTDANTAPAQGRTYFFRYPASDMPDPAVAGTAQYCEAAFQPGRSVYFAMKVADEEGNWSAMSNVESTTVRVAADTSQARWPKRFVYGVAAPTQTVGNTISKAWPLLYYDSLTVNTVETAKLARNDVVCVNQDAAAQDSFVAAVRDMRARNPRIKILVGISTGVAYRQDDPDTLYDTAKIDGWRLAYYRTWKVLCNITPWPSHFAKPYSAAYGTPAGYTASADSITPSAWAWARGPGRKNVLLGTSTGAWTASAGNTTRNVNIAYRDASGRYLVAESLAVLHKELFYDRTYTERDGSTRRLFDGAFQDLHSFYNTTDPNAAYGDSIDWQRMSAFGSGYANRAEANRGWTDGAVRYDVRLRELTPEWTWYGSNDGTGNNFTASGGYMREGFPSQQGGSWFTNAFWTPGGGFHDEGMHTQRPQFNTVFSFPSTSTVGDSGMAANYWPDTTTWAQKEFRLGLGSAQAWGAHFVYAYSKGSIHHMQTHAAGGYYSWGFDEQAVNRRTGQAVALSSTTIDSAGWLGEPLGPAYFHYPSATGAIFTEDFKSGSAADSSQWGSLTKGADGLVTVRPTTYDGQASVGGNSFMLELRPAKQYHPNYDWKVGATGGSAGRFPVTNGTAITVSFYARADSARWLNVSARDSLAAAIKSGNESPMRVWVGTTWSTYAMRIVPAVGSTRRAELVLSVGDTLGRVLVTGIQVHTGDSVQAIREFQHGAVVVNPGTTGKSHTFGRLTRRLLTRTGTTNSLNNGAQGRTLTTPAGDASFVLWVQDSLRPAPITGLSMNCPCTIGQVSWTATGDDSLTGTPQRYEIRRSLSAIATDSDWSSATLVWTDAAGVQAQGVTLRAPVPGLARNTKYYVAVRAYDDADQPTPIASDSFTTGNCRARRRWF